MLHEAVLNRTIELIEEQYVLADKARELVELMRANSSEYASAMTDHQFAAMITRDMAGVTRDLHLTLEVRADHSPREDMPPIVSDCSVEEGIAYLRITRFPSTNSAKGAEVIREISRAFVMVARASSIVLDVRDNEGGDGSSVALATSYLLPPEPRLLAIYRYRADIAPGENWTWGNLPHESDGHFRPLVDKPACVLVSTKTFSAAEEFAYNLQQLNRAIIVGERTRGGAHPSKRHVIGAGFVLSLPIAETINPISNTNWEGVGVIPDILCAREESLNLARAYLLT